MAVSISGMGAAIAHLGVNTREWTNGLTKAQKKTQSFFAGMQVAAFRLSVAWTATFGAITAATIKFGMDFEREFTGVKKTVELTEPQFESLKERVLEVAAETTFAASELAVLIRKGGQLGVQGEDNLIKFAETLAKLGLAAGELDTEVAATQLARIMSITGESYQNVDILASVLAKLGDSFATTEGRILNFASRISGLSKVTGMVATDTLAMGAAFTAAVPGVELVATQVSKSMGIFANAVHSGGEKVEFLNEFVRQGQKDGVNFAEMFKTNAPMAMAHFLKALDGVRVAGGNTFGVLEKVGLTNQRAAQAFTSAAGASDKFMKALVMTQKEILATRAGQGKLANSFKTQMDTVGAQWDKFNNRIQVGFIKIFEGISPLLRDTLDVLNALAMKFIEVADAFKNAPSWARTFLVSLVAITGAVIALTFAVGALGSTMGGIKAMMAQGAASILKTAGVFQVQSAAAGALGTTLVGTTGKAKLLVKAINLGKKAMALAGPAAMVLAAAFAGWKIGKWIAEWTGLSKVMDQVFAKITGARIDSEGKSIIPLTGKEIDNIKAINKQLGTTFELNVKGWKKAQAAAEEARRKKLGITGNASTKGTLEFEVQMAKAKTEEEKKRAEASRIVLREVTDIAEAEEIIRIAKEAGLVTDTGISEEKKKQKQLIEDAKKAQQAYNDELFGMSTLKVAEDAQKLETQFADLAKMGLEPTEAAFASAIEQIKLFDKYGIALGPTLTSMKDKFNETSEEIEALAGPFKKGTAIADKLLSGETVVGMAGMGTTMGPGGEGRGALTPQGSEEAAEAFADNWIDAIRDVQKMFKAFGFDAESALGQLVKGGLVFANMFQKEGAFAEFMSGGAFAKAEGARAKFGVGLQAVLSGVAGVMGATGKGSQSKRMIGGAMQGAQAGAAFGPWGAAIGGLAGAIVGAFRGRAVNKAIKDVAKLFGKEISEELAEKLVESGKKLGSMSNAIAANLGDVLEETGVTSKNIGSATNSFGQLIGMVQNGTLSISEATEQINKSFSLMVEHLETLGTKGALAIGELVQTQLQAGVMTKETEEFLKQEAATLRGHLAPAIEYINSLQNMTTEQAGALQGALVAAWAGAVVETGSFIEAVQVLGDEFGQALTKIIDTLGPGGENLVGPIAEIFNIVSNNEEAFGAFHGMAQGLESMARMGILTKDSLAAMGEAARVTFEDIVTKTGNYNGALKASWPDLIKMREYYQELGMSMPTWLDEAIKKGKEMGLSMEVPLTTQDAMNKMVDILERIAVALGAAAKETQNFANAAGNIPNNLGPGPGKKKGPGFAEGGVLMANPPHGSSFIAGEKENEFIIPESKLAEAFGAIGGGGRASVSVGDVVYNISGITDPQGVAQAVQQNKENLADTIVRKLEDMGKL